jgi:hypothetical protein
MAHYAYLDENNIVTMVVVGRDDNDINWEEYYGAKRTSYNTRGGIYYIPNTNQPDPDQTKAFRKNYASVGYLYDVVLDAFIPPQPYPSWTLDNTTADWIPPTPMPTDGKMYFWNETTQTWDVID